MLKEIFDILIGNVNTRSVPGLSLVFAGLIIGIFLLSLWHKKRFEDYESRIKLRDEQIKEKDTEIQRLKEQLAAEQEFSKSSNNLNLIKEEIEVLNAISYFQRENPLRPNETPAHYSVDNLTADFGIDYGEANKILNTLRRLGLAESIWDNVPIYPNFNRPINEALPVRLSRTGQEFIKKL